VSIIKEAELTKLYYSIGEVASFFDVNASLIRFWEKEFSSIKPKKNKKGNRLFTPKDVLTLDRIYHLVKLEGYTLDGAKKAMRSKKSAPENNSIQNESTRNDIVINRLESLKIQLLTMKSEN
jgi:DNA-binding transcriptional MerR regulator